MEFFFLSRKRKFFFDFENYFEFKLMKKKLTFRVVVEVDRKDSQQQLAQHALRLLSRELHRAIRAVERPIRLEKKKLKRKTTQKIK